MQKKDELIKSIEEQEQQEAQMRQAQEAQQLEQQAILTRSYEAKAQNDFASAQERQGRTISNIGLYAERESEKSQNYAQASLDNVRAIKELADMDDDRLLKLARFVLEMQQAQRESVSDVELKGVRVADFVGQDVDIANKKTELPQQAPTPQSAADNMVAEASPI